MIIREALENDAPFIKNRLDIPVCTATKIYHLFQHRDIFSALVSALKLMISDIQSLEGTLIITEYGESMWIRFALTNYQLNKADRYPLRLEVSGLNTIGAGKALDVKLSWYEPISNVRIPYGMLSSHEVNFKKKHLRKKKGIDTDEFADEIYAFLITHLDRIERERELYTRWKRAEISHRSLVKWIDTTVLQKWKYEKAARAYFIAIDGCDVVVKKSEAEENNEDSDVKKKFPAPSKLTQDSSQLRYYVLGDRINQPFVPARNAFDVSLVLGWIASHQGTIPDRLKWSDIPILMEPLVKEYEGFLNPSGDQRRL